MAKQFEIRNYEVLENGALVLATKKNYVLATWKGEFVTWMRGVNRPSAVTLGHYFRDIRDAVKDLDNRAE